MRICPRIASVAVVVISLVLDTLVFAITLIKTYRHFLEMREHNQRSLTGLLMRDGERSIWHSLSHST